MAKAKFTDNNLLFVSVKITDKKNSTDTVFPTDVKIFPLGNFYKNKEKRKNYTIKIIH